MTIVLTSIAGGCLAGSFWMLRQARRVHIDAFVSLAASHDALEAALDARTAALTAREEARAFAEQAEKYSGDVLSRVQEFIS